MRPTRALSRLIAAAALLHPAAAFPTPAQANDLHVRIAIIDADTVGDLVVGRMLVAIRNRTDSPLADVDLSLALAPPHSIELGVLQFGTIPGHAER